MMRQPVFVLCLWAVLVLGGAVPALGAPNLLPNGDFAAGLEGWQANNAAGDTLELDPQVRRGDRPALLLRRAPDAPGKAGYLESDPITVESDAVYVLDLQVRAGEVPAGSTPGLTVNFRSSTDPKRQADVIMPWGRGTGPGPGAGLPVDSGDWRPYRCYYRAPSGTDTARLRLHAPPSGSWWVADVRFSHLPVTRNVPYEMTGVLPVPNYSSTAEPGFMTDGYFCWNQGLDNSKLAMAYTGLEKGITITLRLPRATAVDRLVLALVRPNTRHSIRNIEVRCRKYGELITASGGPGFLSETVDQRLWLIEAPVWQQTDEVELRLTGTGYLIPYEVLVVEDQDDAEGREEQMKSYALAGWFVLAAATASAQPLVVIENEYLRMEFQPAEGGVCKRMLYKPTGAELVYSYSGAGYGLLRDRFWSPTQRDFATVVYRHELTTTPLGVSLHLWGRGAGGIYGFTDVHKTITLTNASPLVQVRYEIANAVESMTDADYGFWVHNFLGVMGGTNRYFIPCTDGVKEVLNDPDNPPRDKELWLRNPARGWMAGVGEGGTGLAWSVDYKFLNLFYQFLGIAIPTCEWQYNRLTVPSGGSFSTEVTLMPFTGLERVDGYFRGLSGALAWPVDAAPGAKLTPTAELVAAGDRELTLRFRSRLLPATEWTEQGVRQVKLVNAAAQSVPWPQELPIAAGTTVLACEVSEGGEVLGTLERPLVAGEPSGQFALAPEGPQVGSKEPPGTLAQITVPEHKLSMEVVSPHVPWARPYAGGPIRALILTDCGRQREIVELMQRFDLQVETEKLFFSTDGFSNEVGEQSVRSREQALARLKVKLQQPWDVIMIAGLHWEKGFDEEARQTMLEQVRAGTGLVLGGPVGVSADLQEALPFATGEQRSGFGYAQVKRSHFLTDGIPFELLPSIAGLAYAGEMPEDQVLLTHTGDRLRQERPLLGTGTLGRGRWVCLLWDVYTHGITGEGPGFSRITPMLNPEADPQTYKPARLSDQSGREITWRYWDYTYSLLGRGLLWAAGREPGITAEIGAPDPRGGIPVNVQAAEPQARAVLELTFRNKFSEEQGVLRQEVALPRGQSAFSFTPPDDLMPGLTLTDLRVLNPEGQVITWASSCYQTPAPLQIATLEVATPVIPAGSPPVVRGQVALSAEAGPGHSLQVLLTDLHGRLVCSQTAPVTGATLPFEARPLDTLATPMTLEVRLLAGTRLLDRRSDTVLLLREVAWDPMRCNQCEWYSTAFHRRGLPYLYDLSRQLAASMGITCMMNNPRFSLLNIEANALSAPLAFLSIDDPRAGQKVNAYAATGDTANLVREPCLWDPEYRAKAREAMLQAATIAMQYGGGYSYCLGDEMSLSSHSSYADFDFAPASIAAYRRWLQERYGTIRALNGEWGSAYRDWGEIMPMTATEARTREDGNYAPWADFRSFMDDSLAGFFDYLQSCLREVDPEAKISISGTQNSAAGNGMDWWKLCHSLRMVHSYMHSNTQYLHQSFSRSTGALVAPYLHNACGRASGPSVEARHWWGMFYECFGQTSLGTPNYFLPDLTPSEIGATTKAYLAEANGGTWMLTRSARRDPAPIALLYSHPSIQANFIVNREQRYDKARDAWISLLHDMGLQLDFVAYEELKRPGLLAERGYKVLVLFEALALSAAEVEQVEAFVRAGGVLIADNSIGWMDEHCRALPAGQLDALMGVTTERDPLPSTATTFALARDWGGLQRGDSIAGFSPVTRAQASGAEAVLTADQSGAIFVRSVGRGSTVYLNLSLVPYREDRELGGPGEVTHRRLVAGALARAGVAPEIVAEPAGRRQFQGHIVTFTDGDTRYLGIIRDYRSGEPEDAFTFRLPGAFEVYDVRARNHLGRVDHITAVLYAGQAKLYCLAPATLPAPTLTAPARAAAGSAVTCRVGPQSPVDRHTVIRLEVYDPSGALRPYYSGPQQIGPGVEAVPVSFPLALNDPPGEWTLRAVDIAGGQEVSRGLTVTEG